MQKLLEVMSIEQLARRFRSINFPEFQREPNIWDKKAKQRLIDSIMRSFDISSLYFYEHEDTTLDCIDGRQRISAIMAFIGENEGDADNEFEYQRMNEIYDDIDTLFGDLNGNRFNQIKTLARDGNNNARDFVTKFNNYLLTIVKLADSREYREFHLQFTRLNPGIIINSGEKLHAMLGAMRDECFSGEGIGGHPFLGAINIPTRRFAREQVAAQILCQVFALNESGEYTRTRHYDLQLFFKRHTQLTAEQRTILGSVKEVLDHLHTAFTDPGVLRNRAMTLSTVLLAFRREIQSAGEATQLAEFINAFLRRLRWQLGLGLETASEYRELIVFQRNLTQASVEKPAVATRARILEEQYEFWRANRTLPGDTEYQTRTGRNPAAELGPA